MDIEKQLCAIAEILGCKFVFKGEPIAYEKVFSVKGLLPAIMRRADQLCSFCMGYGLGLNFERSTDAMVGVMVEFDEVTPASLRILCATDVIVELIQQSPNPNQVVVDDLAND